MNRKLERTLVIIGAIWQILSGLITIFIYGSFIKNRGNGIQESTFAQMKAVQSLFGSLYTFTVTFGILFVVLGLFHLYMARNLEDNKVEKKLSTWFLFIGAASYFLMDIISAVLYLSAGILALAKNKSISKLEQA